MFRLELRAGIQWAGIQFAIDVFCCAACTVSTKSAGLFQIGLRRLYSAAPASNLQDDSWPFSLFNICPVMDSLMKPQIATRWGFFFLLLLLYALHIIIGLFCIYIYKYMLLLYDNGCGTNDDDNECEPHIDIYIYSLGCTELALE